MDRNKLALGAQGVAKLKKTTALVVAEDYIRDFTVLGLAGLGLEHIVVQTNSRSHILKACGYDTRVEGTHVLNDTRISSIKGNVSNTIVDHLDPDIVIVDGSQAKVDALQERGIIYANANQNTAAVSAAQVQTLEGKQHPTLACLAAGVALEEVRKTIAPYTQREQKLQEPFVFEANPTQYKGQNLLIIGAGGIGVPFSILAGLNGAQTIDICDSDEVEATNFNRQFAHWGKLGHNKATSLVAYLNKVVPIPGKYAHSKRVGKITSADNWLHELYQKDKTLGEVPSFDEWKQAHFLESGNGPSATHLSKSDFDNYSLICGCVDNKYARKYVEQVTKSRNIAYLDGSCIATSARSAYVPTDAENTMDQLIDISEMPPEIIGCAARPDPSIMATNLIAAALMALQPLDKQGPVLEFDTRYEPRIYST